MDDFSVRDSFENALEDILGFLPELLGGLVLLIVGYIVAKVLAGITRRALHKLRFDRALHTSTAGTAISRMVESPSRLVGGVVFWLVFVAFISFAAAALDLEILNRILAGIYAYVPNIIASILIFLVASAISAGTAKFILGVMGRTPTAKLITAVVPGITMSLAVFMILNQLKIAEDIVTILFTAIVGAVALGLALAFGLGGRDLARDLLSQAYNATQQNAGPAKADMRRAAANTRRKADELQQ